jgi:hypothetical protein
VFIKLNLFEKFISINYLLAIQLTIFSRFKDVKDKIFNNTFSLNKWTSLTFILIFAGIAVFESIIIKFSSYSGVEFPKWSNITIFVIFFTIFAISTTLLLISVKRTRSRYRDKQSSSGDVYFRGIIIATQILTVTIILMIIFQMIFYDKYSLILLQLQTFLSRLSGLVLLSALIFLFVGWLISKRNYIVMLYALSFSLLAINLMVSLVYLIYLQSYLTFPLPDVKPFPIVMYAANIPGSLFTESLALVFDILSITSFILMWTATLISLNQYRHRMGRLKYFILMSVPLIYYIFPFHNYFGDIFFPLLQLAPVFVSVIYVLIFMASEQVAAVLFSLVFWTSSTLVYDDRVRKNLLISAIGIALIFGSIEISTLQYHVYPPYGLVTQAFIPIGAYLLLVGTFSSAKQISQDAELRKDFYKSAKSQLSLLRTMGVTQMEKELIKKFKSAEKRTTYLEKNEEYYEEENVKQIVHEVLEELKNRDTGKTKES